MATGEEAFELGRAAGIIEQRLDGHDKHFTEINGSIRDSVIAMTTNALAVNELKMAIQRLDDRMKANQETVITTAAAVESERSSTAAALVTTRTTAETKWSPWNRFVGVVVAVAAVAAAIAAFYGVFGTGK